MNTASKRTCEREFSRIEEDQRKVNECAGLLSAQDRAVGRDFPLGGPGRVGWPNPGRLYRLIVVELAAKSEGASLDRKLAVTET